MLGPGLEASTYDQFTVILARLRELPFATFISTEYLSTHISADIRHAAELAALFSQLPSLPRTADDYWTAACSALSEEINFWTTNWLK